MTMCYLPLTSNNDSFHGHSCYFLVRIHIDHIGHGTTTASSELQTVAKIYKSNNSPPVHIGGRIII